MDNHLKSVYLRQIKEECEFCLAAVQQMNLIMEKQKDGDFFREALDLVHHSAAVSRMLWPPGCRDKAKKRRSQRRGEALRGELDIKNEHAIRNRTLRDHFEHFDERLDDWAENSKNRDMIGKFFGPRDAIHGIDDKDIIHHYDPATKKYVFRGEEFDIQELVDGINDIYAKVSNC